MTSEELKKYAEKTYLAGADLLILGMSACGRLNVPEDEVDPPYLLQHDINVTLYGAPLDSYYHDT